MDDRRKHTRTKLEIKCHLKGHVGDFCEASLDDISLSGALILVNDVSPFQIGDSCELTLGGITEGVSIKHYCKVVRVGTRNIGLKFPI
jgi:c-di-GMP-binding flagellar brake protein YcgR